MFRETGPEFTSKKITGKEGQRLAEPAGGHRLFYSIDTNSATSRANMDRVAVDAELQITCADKPLPPVQPTGKLSVELAPVQLLKAYWTNVAPLDEQAVILVPSAVLHALRL